VRKAACLLAIFVVAASSLMSGFPKSAAAISAGPQPSAATTTPNILITSIVADTTLEDLEIYNQSDAPIDLAGWSFSFTIKDGGNCSAGETSPSINFPDGWMLSKAYLTFENGGNDAAADIFSVGPAFGAGCSNPWLTSIQISDGSTAEQIITIPDGAALSAGVKQKQRDNSSSSARTLTGTFATDYAALTASDIAGGLFSDPLYTPPDNDDGLQVVEILPRAAGCSPVDTGISCSDFVKVVNDSGMQADLSHYALAYKSSSSASISTVPLSGLLDAGKFAIINTKDDGSPISLTDSGGYVWLEDVEGIKIYAPVVQYPSASSDTKIGWAWAFDGSAWQWTSEPTLDANTFPLENPEVQTGSSSGSGSSSLKPCAADQYRNPATNRCKKIVVSASTLVPCKPDQERNPATNRCRSILAASSTLTPCKTGQERNPATNRCHSVTAASNSLTPCQPGWSRNPATNRCRKTSAVKGDSIANIQDVKAPIAGNNLRWLFAAAAITGALAYAFYEWRQEIMLRYADVKVRAATILRKK
jgi:hypothetical protein